MKSFPRGFSVVSILLVMMVLGPTAAQGDSITHGSTTIDMDFVTVGNPGNANDAKENMYGGVPYTFHIAKYEVTAGQYATWLNGVAKSDPHALYNTDMDSSQYGCQITRHGTSGSYTYDFSGRPSGAESDWSPRPVNYVSFYDMARFANWLTSGDTETGVYNTSTLAVDRDYRNADGMAYVIPTENEWYKAAYHKNDGVTGNYSTYPTGSDTAPTPESPPGGANSANYNNVVGGPYYRTPVGSYTGSASSYGTFDQGGNVMEVTETLVSGSYRVRGGNFWYNQEYLQSDGSVASNSSTYEYLERGFRIASIPEPGTVTLVLVGLIFLIRRRLFAR